MPHAEQLPEDLKELAYRNCCELTHARWKSDIQLLVDALRRTVGDSGQSEKKVATKQPTASSQRGTPKPEASGSAQLANATSARIDPATMQRVGRELALHIGPIADIVVKRVAPRCSSTEDLYLKVAEEIESRQEREKFLSNRLSSTVRSDVEVSARTPTHASAALGSLPISQENRAESRTIPATGMPRPNQSKYLLLGGAVALLVLALVLVVHFAPSKGTESTHAAQASQQETHTAESAQVKSDTSAAVMGNSGGSSISGGVPKDSMRAGVEDNVGSTNAALKVAMPQRARVSQDVSAGLLIRKVVPVYPATAQQARVQGAVVLQAEISKDGAVEELRGISGHPLLIPAAIDAVKQWQYKPYMQNGEPVAMDTTITVDFTLKSQ